MCEIAVTQKLYRAAVSLSYVDSYFFKIKGISSCEICLLSVPLQKNI